VSFLDRLVVVAAGGDRGGVTANVSRK